MYFNESISAFLLLLQIYDSFELKWLAVTGFWPIVPGIVAGENSFLYTNNTINCASIGTLYVLSSLSVQEE